MAHVGGRLEGKVAIVTGASRGQGEAEARLFAAEGATVVLADVLDAEGQAVADDIGVAATYVHLDVSDESQWAAAVELASGLGPVEVLVNNAAILLPSAIEDTSLEQYLQVINVNQVGTFLGMKAVFGAMRSAGKGSKNGLISYTASKFAIRGMTKTAAIEWGRFGIRVNSIHPGGVNTAMGNPLDMELLETAPYQLQAIPRIGYPPEIAYAALFLASDEASYVTGAELSVDGGWRAGVVTPGLPGTSVEFDLGGG